MSVPHLSGLYRLVANGKRLTDGRLFVLTFKESRNRQLIIQLNQEFQLELGELADDTVLPFYSEVSQTVYGKPNTRWTLKDTGEFYESFKITTLNNTGFTIYADTEKEDKDLADYGAVLGLSYENLVRLQDEVIPTMRKYLLEILLK